MSAQINTGRIEGLGIAIGTNAYAEAHIGAYTRIEGDVYYHTSTVPPLDYRSDISHILSAYTPAFVGRTDVLQALGAFAQRRRPGYLLVTAPAGYGKSALLAQTVLRHETGAWESHPLPRLLYFFIRQEGQRNTPEDFLRALNSQLLQVLQLDAGIPHGLPALRSQYSQLWSQAVQGTRAHRPLLLVVDGLDEIAPGAVTIAQLLPTHLADYVHVIVSSRPAPEPRRHVSREHPLRRAEDLLLQSLNETEVRDLLLVHGTAPEMALYLAPRLHRLTRGEPLLARFVSEDIGQQGEAALLRLERGGQPPQGVREYFLDQLDALAPSAQGLNRRLLGLLAVTLGGITTEELADVFKLDKQDVDNAIKPVQRFLIGHPHLEFMHLALREAVADLFSPHERHTYRQALLAWCRSYEAQHWPARTPDYVLAYYSRHLHTVEDREALYRLIARGWMDVQFARTRAYRSFATDVQLSIELAEAEAPPNWVPLIRGCLIYSTLSSMVTDMPLTLLEVLVQLGDIAKARDSADLIQEAFSRSLAFWVIGEGLLAQGLAHKAAEMFEEALAAVERLDDQYRQARLRSYLAEDLYKAGRQGRALEVARQAFAMAASLEDKWQKKKVLDVMASALAFVGLFEQALASVFMLETVWEKRQGLGRLAPVFARAGKLALLLTAVQGLEDAWDRTEGFSSIAKGLVQEGLYAQAHEVARGEASEFAREQIQLRIAEALAHKEDFAAVLHMIRGCDSEVEPETVPSRRRFLGLPLPRLWGRKRLTASPPRGSVWEETWKARALEKLLRTLALTDQKEHMLPIAREACASAMTFEPLRRVRLLSQLPRVLARAGDTELAIATAHQAWTDAQALHCAAQRAEALSEVAHAFAATGQQLPGQQAAEQAVLLSEQTEASKQSWICYNVAKALAQLGGIEQALVTAQKITAPGDKALAYGWVAQALVRAGQEERAAAIATQSLAMAREIADDQGRSRALSALAGVVLAEAGMFELAFPVVRAITESREQASGLSHLAYIFAREEAFERAVTAAKAIGDYTERNNALRDIALLWAYRGKAHLALQAVKAQDAEWPRATLLSDTMRRLRAKLPEGQFYPLIDQALCIARDLAQPAARSEALSKIAGLLVTLQRVEEATALVEEVLASIEMVEPRQQPQRAVLLRAIAEALIEVDALTQALSVAETIDDAAVRCAVLAEIARGFVRVGAPGQAVALAARVVALARNLEQTPANTVSLNQAVASLARSPTLTYALSVAESAPGDERRALALAGIARSLAEAGEQEQAAAVTQRLREAINALVHRQTDVQVLSRSVEALVQAGALEEAFTLTGLITPPGSKAMALVQVAQGLAEAGAPERAQRLVSQALELLPAIETEWSRIELCGGMAYVLAQGGAEDEITNLVERITGGDVLHKDYRQVWALREAAVAVARAGKASLARAITARIVDGSERQASLLHVAQALLQAGKKDDASALVQHALDLANGRGEQAQLAIQSGAAQVLAMAGHLEQALVWLQTALQTAYPLGRESVLKTLTTGARALAAVDRGKSLWQVYETLLEVESWWRA